MSKTLLAKLHSEVALIWHLYSAEEGTTFVGLVNLNRDFFLKKLLLSKSQGVVCVFKHRRLVLILSHSLDSKKDKSDHATLLIETHLELHSTEAVFDDTSKSLVLALHHHRLKFLCHLWVLAQVCENRNGGWLRAVQTQFSLCSS